ncbi:MAG TPA: hypothetical protein VM600_06435 [Actinomycetota bacterium]|nr:hypothetical protein [Actinomycetota bacterium]
MLESLVHAVQSRISFRSERGAVGALIIGIVIGVILVVFGIIKFLIPGE